MNSKLIAAAALAVLALGAPAQADLCTIEATPAATLLLPYFEVDIANPNGVDTFFSINNASSASVLTHVIVWTDMSVEALDFNVYLTGYDVQTIGLGIIIRNGWLPRTAASNAVSNRGAYSDPHVVFAGCAAIMPYTNPALNADFLAHLQSILTGGPSTFYGGLCGGFPHGDGIARGYVTVDVVNSCTLLTHCDVGYFSDDTLAAGTGIAEYDNVIWGEWYRLNYAENFAQGDTLVHIEAAAPTDTVAQAALFAGTFYNRCYPGFQGVTPAPDLREPLGTTYATQFYQNAAFSGGTDFVVWKDSQYPNDDGFSCAGGPGWFPIPEAQVIFFDEQENPEAVCTISPCPQEDVLFPLEAQSVAVSDIGVTPQSGWVYLNLNQNYGGPPTFLAQAWAASVHSAEGRFSAGLNAIQLDSYCDTQSIIIGPSGPDFPYAECAINWFNGNLYGDCPLAPEEGAGLPNKSWN